MRLETVIMRIKMGEMNNIQRRGADLERSRKEKKQLSSSQVVIISIKSNINKIIASKYCTYVIAAFTRTAVMYSRLTSSSSFRSFVS